MLSRVSVQGIVSLGDHFATLCLELDFYEVKNRKNSIIFQKENGNAFTLLIIFTVKSFTVKIAQIYYYDPQSIQIH